jgi:broad specificity phosphatase PhoE
MRRRDPGLTPEGEQQCASLSLAFPLHSHISQVFASPLQRTIATAYIAFKPSLRNGRCIPEILALPDAQETSEHPCDCGPNPSDLRRSCEEAGWKVDLSLVQKGWNDKRWDGRWAPTARAIKARARDARRTIREKLAEMQKHGEDSPQVVLVSHGGFLHYFTEDWEDSGLFSGESAHDPCDLSYFSGTNLVLLPVLIRDLLAYNSGRISDIHWAMPGTGWANTEYRSYTFESNDDINAGIRETVESRKRRGKTGRQPSRTEQRYMFEIAMKQWEHQGMQIGAKVAWRDEMENEIEERESGEEPAAGIVLVESRRDHDVRI